MYYKLSNNIDLETIEKSLGISFKYPNLYKKAKIINGMDEVLVNVVTMDEPNHINYGIWGILPESYKGDWRTFQSMFNSLTINNNTLNGEVWLSHALQHKRCVVIASGFYTNRIDNGRVVTTHVWGKNQIPLCFAGIYNVLEDGFLTCSLLVSKSNDYINDIHNISDTMPIIIDRGLMNEWLGPKYREFLSKTLAEQQNSIELQSQVLDFDVHGSEF